MNTIGSFHCECYPGYVYDEASHQCIDKNECLEDNPCQGTVIQINNFSLKLSFFRPLLKFKVFKKALVEFLSRFGKMLSTFEFWLN